MDTDTVRGTTLTDADVRSDERRRFCDTFLSLLKLADVQLLLAQTEKSYFETKLKLERVAAESQALLQEKQKLQRDREELGKQLRQTTEDKHQVEERWMQLQSSPP